MITVEIRSSNLDFFEKYELEERLSYSDFHKVSENMQEGEYIEFTLYNEEEQPFYKGKFEKGTYANVTEDIRFVLANYQKEKKITKQEKKQIESQLAGALKSNLVKDNQSPIKKERKKIELFSKINLKAIPIKKIGIAFAFVILLTGIGGGIHFIAGITAESKPTLAEYLENEQYEQAAQEYPKKISEIENQLFLVVQEKGRNHLSELISFQKKYPTEIGRFDIAMFEYEYAEGITVYEADPKMFESDSTRSLLVGYAYLKENKLKQAEEVQQVISSPELEKFIRQYKHYTSIIEEKEKEISELQKKPSENKEKIEKAIETLYDAKKALSEL